MSNIWLDFKKIKKEFPIGYFVKKIIFAGQVTGYKYIDDEWKLEINHGDWYLSRNMID